MQRIASDVAKKWNKRLKMSRPIVLNVMLNSFMIQKSSGCPSLVVSCPKFDLAHNKAHCKGRKGDFISLGKKRFEAVVDTTTEP